MIKGTKYRVPFVCTAEQTAQLKPNGGNIMKWTNDDYNPQDEEHYSQIGIE
jgi:hypothetical protein